MVRRTWSFRIVQLINLICLYIKSLGDSSGGGTPGPIPNPAVKPASADGTGGAAPWESRSLPRDFSFSTDKMSISPLMFSPFLSLALLAGKTAQEFAGALPPLPG